MDPFCAALMSDLESARRMVEEGTDVNGYCLYGIGTKKTDNTYLRFAVIVGRLDAVRFLLEQGANPDLSDWESGPLYIAILMTTKEKLQPPIPLNFSKPERHEILKLLLKRGTNYSDTRDWLMRMPFFFALESASLECVKLLLEHGADIT